MSAMTALLSYNCVSVLHFCRQKGAFMAYLSRKVAGFIHVNDTVIIDGNHGINNNGVMMEYVNVINLHGLYVLWSYIVLLKV